MTALNGKIALVTGATRGIGLETARQLGALGATLLLAARDLTRAETQARTLAQSGITAHPVKLDVRDTGDVESLAEYLQQNFGRLDILVNNAAVWLESASGSVMPENTTSTISPALLREIFDTNFFSLVAVTQTLLPLIRKSESGRIVNVSSILGSLSLHSDPNSPIFSSKAFGYNASKTAVNAFTIHLAHELRDTAIKVNSAHPGWVRTAIGGESAGMDIKEGAQTAVKLASLGADGPSGGFFHIDQTLPW